VAVGKSPKLFGVGVGPGDPELVTVKGVRVLREADIVFVPVAVESTEPGRAEGVVLHYVEAGRVVRLEFSLSDDSALREANWERAATTVADAMAGAATAAFATIGDPAIYSTFTYLAARVRSLLPGVGIELVPGITAMQDLAARSGMPLVQGNESLALLPLTAGLDRLRSALEAFDAIVCYKGGEHLPEILEVLAEVGRLDDAVYGARLGLEGQQLGPARDMEGRRGPYLSTLIVPPKRVSPSPEP
jgi:precorrin-2/cobalt-factor-2 C20-methyltransferase